MKTIASFLFLLAIGTLHAQVVPIAPGPARVISTTGLSLRAAPRADARRLAVASTNAKVEVLDSSAAVLDSLPGLLVTAPQPYRVARHGHWVKVRFDGQTGYMLDLFLKSDAYWRKPGMPLAGLNKDFHIWEPGGGCRDNFYYDPSFHYYGLYVAPDGESSELRPVDVRQFIQRDDFLSSFWMAEDMDYLHLIIGARHPLPIGRDCGAYTSAGKRTYLTEAIEPGSGDHLRSMHDYDLVPDTAGNRYWGRAIFLERAGLRQKLNPKEVPVLPLVGAMWIGDLDGDGHNDYVLNYGEKVAHTILYLSSQRGKGELVRPVAVYYSGYCC